MQEVFKIWIDRLGEGNVQKIDGSFASSFLEVDEQELKFPAPVQVTGEAYLADQHLVIHLTARTTAAMPCTICNQMIETELAVKNFYHSEALEEIPSAVFDFAAPLREALLIELPHYFECCNGNCPERANIAPYLRSSPKAADDKKINLPFADL